MEAFSLKDLQVPELKCHKGILNILTDDNEEFSFKENHSLSERPGQFPSPQKEMEALKCDRLLQHTRQVGGLTGH